MSEPVRFSYALNARIRAFLDVAQALRELKHAAKVHAPLAWLQAAADLRDSMLGEHQRKPALGEIQALLAGTRNAVRELAARHPEYAEQIRQTCNRLERHLAELEDGAPELMRWLSRDALIAAFHNALKKQDWLAHKPALADALTALWPENAEQPPERAARLTELVRPLAEATATLEEILYNYVPWERRIAEDGSDQISPPRNQEHGLLVIALPADQVAQGVVPNISGNRLAIRLRFLRLNEGGPSEAVGSPVEYAMMLVPLG